MFLENKFFLIFFTFSSMVDGAILIMKWRPFAQSEI